MGQTSMCVVVATKMVEKWGPVRAGAYPKSRECGGDCAHTWGQEASPPGHTSREDAPQSWQKAVLTRPQAASDTVAMV